MKNFILYIRVMISIYKSNSSFEYESNKLGIIVLDKQLLMPVPPQLGMTLTREKLIIENLHYDSESSIVQTIRDIWIGEGSAENEIKKYSSYGFIINRLETTKELLEEYKL